MVLSMSKKRKLLNGSSSNGKSGRNFSNSKRKKSLKAFLEAEENELLLNEEQNDLTSISSNLANTTPAGSKDTRGSLNDESDSQLESNSVENSRLQEEMYDQRISELRSQLEALNKLDILPTLTSSDDGSVLDSLVKMAAEHESKCGLFNYVEHYVRESARLERESKENLLVLKAWYERQREQLQQQHDSEQSKARQELLDRQKELKESLLNEYEEMRRQLETDKTSLDINMDVTDAKPVPTRKLRRRMKAILANGSIRKNIINQLTSSH